ncbi:MAG: ABC transporter permease [Clostridia bacterium]|nr:ABC transporter permease [Clostridia bacterium]
MNFSLKRVSAILIKELQDIRRNANISCMYLIPVFMVVLYQNFMPEFPRTLAIGFGLLFLVVLVGMYAPSMLIAEEKEKKTIGVLMLSPASPVEVFIGKGLLTLLSIIFVSVVILFVGGNGLNHFVPVILSTFLISVFCIIVGMIVGLLAQNQMATGVIGLPIYMIFLLIPFLSMAGKDILLAISKVLPTYYYFKTLELTLDKNKGILEILPQMGVLAGSIAVVFFILLAVYKKKGLE